MVGYYLIIWPIITLVGTAIVAHDTPRCSETEKKAWVILGYSGKDKCVVK